MTIVYRYISKTEIIKYTFGLSDNGRNYIPITIFQDDTILKVLTKIAIGINEHDKDHPISLKTIPYAWYKNTILRFERINDIKPINPWDGVNLVKNKSETIKYIDNKIYNLNEIHIVFASDLKSMNEIYFPNSNIEWKINATYESTKKESDFLNSILNNNKQPINYNNFIYTRVKYNGLIKKWREGKKLNCYELFNKMHTYLDIPFIQLVEDSSKILYKVFKKHTINNTQFSEWTTYDNIPKVAIITVMFTISSRKNTYGKMSIDNNGILYIEYKLDSREKTEWNILQNSIDKITKWLEKYVAKISITLESISLKGNFTNKEGRKIKELTDLLSKLHLLYHYHKIQNNFLEVSFKRSANFKNNIDVSDIITSEIRRGVPIYDIVANLIELGMQEKDALEWVQQYSDISGEIEAPKKKLSLKETGCILVFSETTTGFNVQIENLASFDEIKSVSSWIQGTINIPKKLVIKKEKSPSVTSSSSSSSSTSTINSSNSSISVKKKSSSSNDDIFNEDVGELSLGGALGKKNRGYFLKLLQQSDPAIFRDHKNYARECLGNNFRQPITLTNEEKARIDATEYKDSYDNSIKYGSDENHINNYICPRIWCPISKIPLTSEQLSRNNGKCPGPNNEEPLLLYESEYWDNNPNLKHNVGFLNEGKKKTDKGFCLPCCMKKETKDEALRLCNIGVPGALSAHIDEPESKKQKETYYIKSTGAPLPVDRYGVIPKDMFLYLFPDELYLNCTNTIKTNQCLLRKGINHENNSFMSAIAYILGFDNIKKLVRDISDKLDLATFISIENSLLLRSFMDTVPIIPDHEISLHKQWQKSVDVRYKSLVSYDTEYQLARELTIYKAYLNFINYLHSNSNISKNPLHLINVLTITHNIQIIVFKKNGANSAIVQCPMYYSLPELLYITSPNKLYLGLLIEDNEFYEPLELKRNNREAAIVKFDINYFLPIKELLNKCPIKEPIIRYIETIRNLIAWTDYDLEIGTLNSPSSFRFQSIIIRPDMRIYGFITKSNIIITLPSNGYPISILPILLPIKHIVYLEDIYDKEYIIDKVYRKDLETYIKKIQRLGLGLILGIQKSKPTDNMFSSTLIMPHKNPHIIPAMYLSNSDNKILNTHRLFEGHSRKWYQVQKAIGTEIIKYYDSLVVPLLDKTKKDRINILMRTFKRIPQKHIVRMTLEEMPLSDGLEANEKWVSSINIEVKSSIYSSANIKSNSKDEWIFSQSAVDNGIDPVVLNYENEYIVKDLVGLKGQIESVDSFRTIDTLSLPDALNPNPELNRLEKLPSKWNRFKNADFDKFTVYNANNYDITYIPKLMEYIAKTLYIPFDYSDIIELRYKAIFGLINDKNKLGKIFEDDPAMLIAWNKELKKKYKTFNDLWDAEKTNIKDKWENVYKNQQIWTTDIDFYIFAKLMNINILIIKRLEYGEGKDIGKRNEINELYISSYYYGSTRTRPLIILYKQKTKLQKYTQYSAIVNANIGFFIKSGDVPRDIETIIDYHLDKN